MDVPMNLPIALTSRSLFSLLPFLIAFFFGLLSF